MDMTDITLEQIRMLFNQQFGIFTIDSIVFGIGLTIGGITGKFAKVPQRILTLFGYDKNTIEGKTIIKQGDNSTIKSLFFISSDGDIEKQLKEIRAKLEDEEK